MTQKPLNVGLIGLGTVGAQVAQRVLVRDPNKRRALDIDPKLVTADPSDVLEDPEIDVVLEVAGGDEPMRSYLERAIRAGKHVITANQAVMANHGAALL